VSYRRISEVAEVVGIEEDVIQLNKIYEWNPEKDIIENVGIASQTLTQIANLSGKSLYELSKEIDNRKIILRHMINHNIHTVNDVNAVLELYYDNPQKVLNRIILNR
jgi:flagellar protein FlaI